MFTLLQENRTELLDSHTAGEGVDANEAVEIIESEEESNVRSTKRPLAAKKGKETKRQNREKQENSLLQKAIVCMEGASNKITAKKDADDIFGENVTSELQAMHNVETKRWVKFRIQSLLFSSQSGMGSPHMTQLGIDKLCQHNLENYRQPGAFWIYEGIIGSLDVKVAIRMRTTQVQFY